MAEAAPRDRYARRGGRGGSAPPWLADEAASSREPEAWTHPLPRADEAGLSFRFNPVGRAVRSWAMASEPSRAAPVYATITGRW